MNLDLTGKSIVVTGAGRGIGAAIARGLAESGAAVTIGDIDSAAAQNIAADICAAGHKAHWAAVDVSKRAQIVALFDTASDRFGPLHGVVNNAGIALTRPFLDMTDEDFYRVMSVNSLGTMIGMQEAARRLVAQATPGRIINIASIGAKQGFEPLALYCASKFSVAAFTQAGAKAFGAKGITVNAICPGVVATQMWTEIDRGFQDAGLTSAEGEAFKAYSQGILLGRPSQPRDLVGMACFLMSKAADYITGQTLVVDGGMIFP
jgi:meso-butanediol dehydrogenase/(S,S)-butanediol dehydrogenase/diacetyl reductase